MKDDQRAIGRVDLGSWITVVHPTVVDLMTHQSQFDWLCVDLEHSPTAKLDLQMAVSIIQGAKKRAFVRVSENRHAEIKFPLDVGVDGIIIPMVNSEKEAKDAVSSCLYPPRGSRGVGLARAQKYGFGFNEHMEQNRTKLEIYLQIEHINGVAAIDGILALPEIAGIFLGPYDLSGSMGIPGQFDHPKMIEAVKHVAQKTLAADKKLGAHCVQPDHKKLLEYLDFGYNFLAFGIDTYFMGQKLKDELNHIRPSLN